MIGGTPCRFLLALITLAKEARNETRTRLVNPNTVEGGPHTRNVSIINELEEIDVVLSYSVFHSIDGHLIHSLIIIDWTFH